MFPKQTVLGLMVCDDISGAVAVHGIFQDSHNSSSKLRRVMASVLHHTLQIPHSSSNTYTGYADNFVFFSVSTAPSAS